MSWLRWKNSKKVSKNHSNSLYFTHTFNCSNQKEITNRWNAIYKQYDDQSNNDGWKFKIVIEISIKNEEFRHLLSWVARDLCRLSSFWSFQYSSTTRPWSEQSQRKTPSLIRSEQAIRSKMHQIQGCTSPRNFQPWSLQQSFNSNFARFVNFKIQKLVRCCRNLSQHWWRFGAASELLCSKFPLSIIPRTERMKTFVCSLKELFEFYLDVILT